MICSCGESNEHTVATRLTSNGVRVFVSSTGSVFTRWQKIGTVPAQNWTEGRFLWFFVGLIELVSFQSLTRLIAVAKKYAQTCYRFSCNDMQIVDHYDPTFWSEV